MIRKVLIFLALCSLPALSQVNCEFSNTGASSGSASVDASAGFAAPGGIGAVGFRIAVPCITADVGFGVLTVDSSASSSPNYYDIGLYCVKGDCETGGRTNKMYVHTGPIPGRTFTNNRVVATITGVAVSGSAGVLTLTKTAGFLIPDFPTGGKVTVSSCPSMTGTFPLITASANLLTVGPGGNTGSGTNCTVKSSAAYPPNFPVANTCPTTPGAGGGDTCMQAFPWISDARTVCTSIPCTLPAGTYAAAIGTSCSNVTATNCAQLRGDDDNGFIYPFVASATSTGAAYDASGLPASITFPTVGATTAAWGGTLKPVKLLIY